MLSVWGAILGAALLLGCSSVVSSVQPTPAVSPTQSAPSATATPATPPVPYARVVNAAGQQTFVKLEVADTPESRAQGLMRRQSLAEDAGMLFAFASDVDAAFWMKDTLIPLSIAFIAADGRIVDIQDMEPLTETPHRPARSYRYALEVNQGFFNRNGVSAGDTVELHFGG